MTIDWEDLVEGDEQALNDFKQWLDIGTVIMADMQNAVQEEIDSRIEDRLLG